VLFELRRVIVGRSTWSSAWSWLSRSRWRRRAGGWFRGAGRALLALAGSLSLLRSQRLP
jgi:hypothetical protein